MVEACKVAQYPFSGTQPIQDLDWEMYLKETANQIVQEQTPRKLSEIRTRLYELITHCIPPEVRIYLSLQIFLVSFEICLVLKKYFSFKMFKYLLPPRTDYFCLLP